MSNKKEFKIATKIDDITISEMKQHLDLLSINIESNNKQEVWEIYSKHRKQLKYYNEIKKNEHKLWGIKKNSITNLFCIALLVVGEKGILMTDIIKCKWNPKKQTFYDVSKKLIKKGYIKKKGTKFFVTQIGIENSPC